MMLGRQDLVGVGRSNRKRAGKTSTIALKILANAPVAHPMVPGSARPHKSHNSHLRTNQRWVDANKITGALSLSGDN